MSKDLFNFSEQEIKEHLYEYYNTVIDKPFYYPNNSIRISDAYKTLLDNVDKVPIEEIESLIEKYKLCI